MIDNKVKIRLNGEYADRDIGWFSKDMRLFYTVRKPCHWFKIFQGFGFNKLLINDLVAKGVEYVIIFYKKFNGHAWVTEHTYYTDPAVILKYGKLYQAEGFEQQLIINKKYLGEVGSDNIEVKL